MNEEQASVPAEVFDAAAAHEAVTLTAYRSTQAQEKLAAHELSRLSCGASFTHEVPGPFDDDTVDIEGECGLPADHDGHHAKEHDHSGTASPAYVKAVASYLDAAKQAGLERGNWHAADEALDGLRCNHEQSSVWPCVKRRGHTGEHEHPAEMHLVL